MSYASWYFSKNTKLKMVSIWLNHSRKQPNLVFMLGSCHSHTSSKFLVISQTALRVEIDPHHPWPSCLTDLWFWEWKPEVSQLKRHWFIHPCASWTVASCPSLWLTSYLAGTHNKQILQQQLLRLGSRRRRRQQKNGRQNGSFTTFLGGKINR